MLCNIVAGAYYKSKQACLKKNLKVSKCGQLFLAQADCDYGRLKITTKKLFIR